MPANWGSKGTGLVRPSPPSAEETSSQPTIERSPLDSSSSALSNSSSSSSTVLAASSLSHSHSFSSSSSSSSSSSPLQYSLVLPSLPPRHPLHNSTHPPASSILVGSTVAHAHAQVLEPRSLETPSTTLPETPTLAQSSFRYSTLSTASFSSIPPERPAPPPPRPPIESLVPQHSILCEAPTEQGPAYLLPTSSSSPSTSYPTLLHSPPSSSSSQLVKTSRPLVTIENDIPITSLSSRKNFRYTTTPAAQTVATSDISSHSPGSFRSTLRDTLSPSLSTVKRHRHQRPFPPYSTSTAASSDVELGQQPPMHHYRRASKDSLSIDYSRSPQATYENNLQQLHEGSVHSSTMASASYTSLSSLPLPLTSKQTLSSKRMRPPLAEISISKTPSILSASALAFDPNSHPHHIENTQTGSSERSRNNMYNINNIKSTSNGNSNQHPDAGELHLHVHSNFTILRPPPILGTHSGLRPDDSRQSPQTATVRNQDVDGLLPARTNSVPVTRTATASAAGTTPTTTTTATTMRSTSDRMHGKRAVPRGYYSRDAKAIRTRIRKLWQDPRQTEHGQSRHDPKNQYVLLEESLAGILQIVPPIIQNAKAPALGLNLTHTVALPESSIARPSAPTSVSINTAESSAGSTTALPSSPPPWDADLPLLPRTSPQSNQSSKSNGSTPSTPMRTRARTNSSNSASTTSATRYQIATSFLQPSEPSLTDVAQPTIRSPTIVSSLGEPALSTIAASAVSSLSSNPLDKTSSPSRLAESNEILISMLLTLSNTFTAAIRTLCEQQKEKVLHDKMTLDLLTRWEQEAGEDDQEQELDNSSATSLMSLGATDALKRYQITEGRVWEETEVILINTRRIRELVEFGRVQHHSDFDDDDSEEDAAERDEDIKKNLYPTLVTHANGLITVLGEFLECVSSIQRLVGALKSQRESEDGERNDGVQVPASGFSLNNTINNPIAGFMSEDPRPVMHLDPVLMRKLKRKTPFKSIAEKMRRSFSDFAKRSTNSLLTIFPPLGDGTNEGFHWDSYSDGEYDSEEWVATEMGSSIYGDDDGYPHTLSPPESPGIMSQKSQLRHRRLSSKDSSSLPEQYWPGSTRLGMSDDDLSPLNTASPLGPLDLISGGQSISFERTVDTSNAQPHPGPPNARQGPQKPLDSLRETAESDSQQLQSFTSSKLGSREKRHSLLFHRRSSRQVPAYTTASISAPIPITSRPFSVYSSGSESQCSSRHNYKARPPKPPGVLPPMPPSPAHSYFKTEELIQETPGINQGPSGRTNSYLAARSISPQQMVPITLDSPFTRQTSIRMGMDRNRYSVKMPSDNVPNPAPVVAHSFPSAFWRRRSYNDTLERGWKALQHEPLHSKISRSGSSGSRPGSGSSFSSIRSLSNKYGGRRHSSPLTLGAEKALSDALSRRASMSSQQSQQSGSQSSNKYNRYSVHMTPTLGEDQRQFATKQSKAVDQVEFIESETLSIPPRPRLFQRYGSHDGVMLRANESESQSTATTVAVAIEQQNQQHQQEQQQHQQQHGIAGTSRTPPEVSRRPASASRYGDMKRAWEILNLDVKRLNQYSHLRAYAKAYTSPNNHWALTHPNALRSATSPRVLHICENGVDVLVLEMFAGHLQIVAGLLENLIERLADQNAQDGEYVSCFLLSHSFFIDSEDLLDRLIARFHIQPRQGEIVYFEKWQKVIQCKILCVLQRWIQIQYEDFELNASLLKTLKNFLAVDVRAEGFDAEAECIEENISIRSLSPKKNCGVIMEQGRFCLQRSRTRKISLSRSQNRTFSNHLPSSPGLGTSHPLDATLPSPVAHPIECGPMPELSVVSPILHLDALELARYLTLADMKAFRSITVFELMSGWWKRRQAIANKCADAASGLDDDPKALGINSANIDYTEGGAIEAFTRRANMLSYWVAHEIVSIAGTKTRKQLIKKFIEVARLCRSLNNLHTAMFIVSALTSTPVRRLSSTWKMVSSRDTETLRQLEKLLDPSGNMRHYRQAMSEAEAPAIPFLPILLKDITFILDGNPTTIPSRVNVPDQTPPASSSSHSGSGTAGTSSEGSMSSFTPAAKTTTRMSAYPVTRAVVEEVSEAKSSTNPIAGATVGSLVNFDKFRQLVQYAENAVDMAKSVDYWFEPQLLRQARVFRPSSPSLHGQSTNYDIDSVHGSVQSYQGRSGTSSGASPLDSSRGALDHISEIVERRLVKASGLYGVQQRVIEVEFSTKSKSTSLWKGGVGVGGGGVGSIIGYGDNNGGGGAGSSVYGSTKGETVIRAVQGEEEYLMGLSLLCDPGR